MSSSWAAGSREEIAATMAINERRATQLLREHRTPDEIENEMPDCRRRVRFDSPAPYIREWADLDLLKAWRDAPDTPMLVLYGSGDFVTSEAESRALENVINQAHTNRGSFKLLSMDHGFLSFGTTEGGVGGGTGVA